MTIFSRPIVMAALAAIFILAGVIGGPESAFDRGLSDWTMSLRVQYPWLTPVVVMLTQLGGGRVTLGLAALAALSLLVRGNRGRAPLLVVTVIGERLLVDGLKDVIGRERPSFDLHEVMTSSLAYPSGHAANGMTAWLAVALLASPASYRRAAAIAAIILSMLIGWSRVYLGVHWPSDVVGGWALGLLAVGVAINVGERTGVMSLESKHDVVAGHLPSASEDQPS
jgi:membrane-associated phospholipid phosphatase